MDRITSRKQEVKFIDWLTSSVSQQSKVKVGLLSDREVMLVDLRTRVALMKRGLGDLTREIKTR